MLWEPLQIFWLCRNQLKLDSLVNFTVKPGSYLLLKPVEKGVQIQIYLHVTQILSPRLSLVGKNRVWGKEKALWITGKACGLACINKMPGYLHVGIELFS